MATTTLETLVQRVLEALGGYYTSTTTGAGSSTTTVDANSVEWGEDDDAFGGWYIRGTSGPEDGNHRRIKGSSGFVASTGTFTHTNAFTSGVGSGATYILTPYDPDEVIAAIGAALRGLYKHGLYLPIRDESIVVDSILLNSGFENLDSGSPTFASWAEVGSPTVTAETSITFRGTNAAKVVASGADGQLRQLVSVNVKEFRGKEITFKMMAFAEAASVARLILISEMGSTETTITDGDYHVGEGEWERLEAKGTVAADAERVIAVCDVTDGNTAYFDDGGDCGLFIDGHSVYKYTVPTTIIDGPHRVKQQYSVDDIDGPYYEIPVNSTPTRGRVLRLEGKGILTRPTTDAGTTEIGPEHEDLVVAQAIVEMGAAHRTRAPEAPEIDVDYWRERVREILSLPGGRMRRMSAEMPVGTWHIEQDSADRHLIFDRAR